MISVLPLAASCGRRMLGSSKSLQNVTVRPCDRASREHRPPNDKGSAPIWGRSAEITMEMLTESTSWLSLGGTAAAALSEDRFPALSELPRGLWLGKSGAERPTRSRNFFILSLRSLKRLVHKSNFQDAISVKFFVQPSPNLWRELSSSDAAIGGMSEMSTWSI